MGTAERDSETHLIQTHCPAHIWSLAVYVELMKKDCSYCKYLEFA